MPNHTKRTDFKNELARLKQARDNGDITEQKYYDQSGYLRFDDETGGQTWWLDPESEKWYVAPLGSEDFVPYQPEPLAPEPEPAPPPEPEPPAPEPKTTPSPESELEPVAPELQTTPPPESEPEPSTPKPEPAPPPKPESPTPEPQPAPGPKPPAPEPEPAPPEHSNQTRVLLIGAAAIIIIAVVCGGFWIYSLLDSSDPTPTQSQVAAITNTPTPEPDTPTPVPPPTKQSSPTTTPPNTPTTEATQPPTPQPSTLEPTAEPSPTSEQPTQEPLPTATPSPLPPVTNTPIPTPEPVFSGKFAYPEFDEKNDTFNVKVVELPTKQEITTIPNASQPALSSDSAQLAYISWANDNIGLYSISLANGVQNPVSKMLEAYRPQWGFVDNQAKVVFEFIKGEQKEIHFSDAPGSGVPDIQKGQTPAWTPDGRLVLQACQITECGLAVVNTNGTGFEFITHNTADIAPTVSPDGQWVAYTANSNIWLVSLKGGTPTQLTDSPGRDGIPTWSPNGKWIAFASEDNMGQWTIQVIRSNGTGQQKLLDVAGNLDSKTCINKCRESGPGWLHESISWSK
ncbi:MAG: hypothetical protein GY796_21820 [Chloroflexi bacterium]|nr:hypothetical protein [Chloroflexota bacterium]